MRIILLAVALGLFACGLNAQEVDTLKNYVLDEVRVTSTRMNTRLKNIPQKVEIIDGMEINSIPAENLADVLKKKTNLDIVQYPGMSSSIGMRGFSPTAHARSYTLLLINGKPAGTTNLSSFNTQSLDRVEIIKGPNSVLYGSDAMGGVINLITKKGTALTRGSASVKAGSFANIKYNAEVSGSLDDKTRFAMGFSRNEQKQDYRIGKNNLLSLSNKETFMLDKASYGDIMRNSQFQSTHINGELTRQLSDNWSLGGEAMYMQANDIETPGNYWGTYGHSKKDINRLNLYGNLEGKLKSQTIRFNPYLTSENVVDYTDNTDDGFGSFRRHIQEYGYKMQDIINLGKLNLLVGTDLDIYDYKSERFKEKATPTNPYTPDHKNSKAAVFSQLAYSKGEFIVNAGARFDYITYSIVRNDSLKGTGGKENYYAFNPSLGAQYTFPFNLKLHTSFGTAYSVPDAFKVAGYYSVSEYFADWDFWWTNSYIGNPDLKPEKSATYDFGLNYSDPNNLLSVDVTYFHTNHTDKIVEYATGIDTLSYKNANDAIASGFEYLFTTNLGVLFDNRFKMELYANFTHMLRNEEDLALTDVNGADSVVTRHMLYTRRSNGNFGVHFDTYHGFSTRLHGRYIGSRLEADNYSGLRPGIQDEDYYTEGGYSLADKILEHPDHFVFDYSVYYTVQKNKKIGITISNLFDENYTEKDAYHMPGRMLIGSFTYTF